MNENNLDNNKHKNTDSKNSIMLSDILIILIVIAVIIAAIGLVTQYFSNRDTEPNFATSVNRVANLTTVQVQAARIGVEAKARRGMCEYWGNYLINGVIEGGIDLTSVRDEDIICDEGRSACTITLPEPSVSLCQFSTVRYHQDTNNLCGGLDYEDLDQIAQFKTSRDIIQDVLAGDVIQRAQDETQVLMDSIFGTFGYETIEIRYSVAPDDAELLDGTCLMENPNGWEERNSGIWERES